MASTIVIDTISSTNTTATFNVVNFSGARYILVQLYNGSSTVYSNQIYIGQFRNQMITVPGLSPGTTYEIRASSGSDVTVASVTTTGTPVVVVSKSIFCATRIAKLDTSYIQGGVNIRKPEKAEITGLVRIVGGKSNYITGRVRVRVSAPEKLPEDWDYSGTSEPEEWEKIDKTSTDWSEVEKSDESWSEVEKDATSWSDGSVAVAEEWNYPLEDAG